jgi:hypothetical protein
MTAYLQITPSGTEDFILWGSTIDSSGTSTPFVTVNFNSNITDVTLSFSSTLYLELIGGFKDSSGAMQYKLFNFLYTDGYSNGITYFIVLNTSLSSDPSTSIVNLNTQTTSNTLYLISEDISPYVSDQVCNVNTSCTNTTYDKIGNELDGGLYPCICVNNSDLLGGYLYQNEPILKPSSRTKQYIVIIIIIFIVIIIIIIVIVVVIAKNKKKKKSKKSTKSVKSQPIMSSQPSSTYLNYPTM